MIPSTQPKHLGHVPNLTYLIPRWYIRHETITIRFIENADDVDLYCDTNMTQKYAFNAGCNASFPFNGKVVRNYAKYGRLY